MCIMYYLMLQNKQHKHFNVILYYGSTPQNKKDHTTHYHHLTTGASSSMVAVDTVPRNAPSQSRLQPSSLQVRSFQQTIKGSDRCGQPRRSHQSSSTFLATVPVLRTNHQRSRVVWPRHRYQVNQAQAFLTNPVWPWPRSHQVNRAPSLPRNPVPVLRTNNQRSRVVGQLPSTRSHPDQSSSKPSSQPSVASTVTKVNPTSLTNPGPSNKQSREQSSVATHGRTKSIELQAFLATQCRSFEQTINGVVLWPRRHEQVPKISTNLVLAYKDRLFITILYNLSRPSRVNTILFWDPTQQTNWTGRSLKRCTLLLSTALTSSPNSLQSPTTPNKIGSRSQGRLVVRPRIVHLTRPNLRSQQHKGARLSWKESVVRGIQAFKRWTHPGVWILEH
jgi:hypothetical protein